MTEDADEAVFTESLALVAPAGMVMLAGTGNAAVLLLASAMTMPPAGAGPFSVTAIVAGLPCFTLVGLTVNELRPIGWTVSEAVFVTP